MDMWKLNIKLSWTNPLWGGEPNIEISAETCSASGGIVIEKHGLRFAKSARAGGLGVKLPFTYSTFFLFICLIVIIVNNPPPIAPNNPNKLE
jgi:hypothetical protein